MTRDTPDPLETAKLATLHIVAMSHRLAEASLANRQDSIDIARSFGATWQEVGDMMGMSRQAAHKHFGRGSRLTD